MIAPPGCDECNYGTERYRVHDDGTVSVPEQAVASLTAGAGFTLIEEEVAPAPSLGSIRLMGSPRAGCSWRGQAFAADDDGVIVAPIEAVADLIIHGFRVAEEG
ncbi:hypothetical protein QM467_00630 [Rhodoblastus sp. 17X3]|uniref:hypothetical protein n=1 Tax=Rhodoblastus sp. 17X3 TaxID=3047026 RepID=UPI0024B77383|nr:hypothetical protein [Rhodoblastus sp. 17X3]MDI9846556.1 hypothetical protein [Rhodoblastus sp. 17X3]